MRIFLFFISFFLCQFSWSAGGDSVGNGPFKPYLFNDLDIILKQCLNNDYGSELNKVSYLCLSLAKPDYYKENLNQSFIPYSFKIRLEACCARILSY